MSNLLVHVLPLALGAMVSPVVLTVAILILGGRAHPVGRAWAFAAGNIAVLIGVGIVYFGGTKVTPDASSSTTVSMIVDIVLGILLVLLGIRSLVHHPAPKQPKPDDASDGQPVRAELPRFFLLGTATMITNFSTLVLYIAAVKDIARSSAATPGRIAVLAIVILIASIPAWLPVALTVVFPNLAGRVLGAINGFVQHHTKAISSVISFGFGAYLLMKGIVLAEK